MSSEHKGDLHFLSYNAPKGAILILSLVAVVISKLRQMLMILQDPLNLACMPSTCLRGSESSVLIIHQSADDM